MRTDNKHIDQSSELTALRNEVSELKAMMFVMQEIIITQKKQITDIHKALFNNAIKTKDVLKEEKKQAMKAQIMMRNIRK